MRYERKKFLQQLGVVVLIAVVLKLLPRFLFFSVMGFLNLAITLATLWILYRLIKIVSHNFNDRYYHKRRPPRYWSDRR